MSKKNIPTHILNALKTIAQTLEPEDINWVVITGCALALHGLDVEPEDIDIMTDKVGLSKINTAFDAHKILLLDNSPSTIFDSTMSRFCINNCSVEVMCNFKIKSQLDDQWHSMHQLLNYRDIIVVEGFAIPVLPVAQLLEMYTLMGRDKDMVKIEKLKQHLAATPAPS